MVLLLPKPTAAETSLLSRAVHQLTSLLFRTLVGLFRLLGGESLSSRTMPARWRYELDPAGCSSPASAGLRARHTSSLSSPASSTARARHSLPSRGGDVVRKAAQSLAQRKHTQALALSRPGQQGVELQA